MTLACSKTSPLPPMKIDFGDVFASGIGFLFKQIFLFLLAIWAGCTAGAISLLAAACVNAGKFIPDALAILIASPMLLLSLWIIPNVLFLGIAGFWFARSDDRPYLSWGIVAGIEALIVVLGHLEEVSDSWLPLTVAWVVCISLMGMVGTGLWFLRQWHINRWACELTMLKAENAVRRSELKAAYGTDSVGNDEWTLD